MRNTLNLKKTFLGSFVLFIHFSVWASDSLKYTVHNLPVGQIATLSVSEDYVLLSDNLGQLIKWSSSLDQIVAMRTFAGFEINACIVQKESSHLVLLGNDIISDSWQILLLDEKLTKIDSQVINLNIAAFSRDVGNVKYISDKGIYFEWSVSNDKLEMICEFSHNELAGASIITPNGTDSFIVCNAAGQFQQWKKAKNNDSLILLKTIIDTDKSNFINDLAIKDDMLLINRRLGYELRNKDYVLLYDDFPKGAYTTFSGENELISISNNGELESLTFEYFGSFIVKNKSISKLDFSRNQDLNDSIIRDSQVINIFSFDTEIYKDSSIAQICDLTSFNFNESGIVLGTTTGNIEVLPWLKTSLSGTSKMFLERNRVAKFVTPLQPAKKDQAILITTEDNVLYGFLWPKGYLQLIQWPNRMQLPVVYDWGAKVYAYIQYDSIITFEDASTTLYTDNKGNFSSLRFKAKIVKFQVNMENQSILLVLADGTIEIVDYANRMEVCSIKNPFKVFEIDIMEKGFLVLLENGDLFALSGSCNYEKISENVMDIARIHDSKEQFVVYNSGDYNYIKVRKKFFNKGKILITKTAKKKFQRNEEAGGGNIFYVITSQTGFVYYTTNSLTVKTTKIISNQLIVDSIILENGSIFFSTLYGELIEINIP